MSESLLILGASARAAAFSSLRAGYRPVCGDLFADVDLQAVCSVTPIERYPAELAEVASAAPAGAWLYTGGLENYPSLVDRISRPRELLGVSGAVLRRVRNPFLVAEALRRAGLPAPECRSSAVGLPTDGSWLIKGRRSSGGGGVAVWRGGRAIRANGSSYFQKRIAGEPQAAVFVAAAGESRLLGVTEQLLASESLAKNPLPSGEGRVSAAPSKTHPHPGPLPEGEGVGDAFRYAGSLGPVPLTAIQRERFEQIGNVLACEFDLAGLFGVDCIVAGDEVWPVEVNPRYTASVEILERAMGVSAIAWHVAACREKRLPRETPASAPGQWFGKVIVYAPTTLGKQYAVVDAELAAEWQAANDDSSWPLFADLPVAGARIAAGRPAFTLFSSASDRRMLREQLAREAAFWQMRLASCR
jgi:predicted ATP-grasp superfamily ATP-dependent carboligase